MNIYTFNLPSVYIPTITIPSIYLDRNMLEYNLKLLELPVRSKHSWKRSKRYLNYDIFKCRKCHTKVERTIGSKPRSKIVPDCDSVVVTQVLWI